jgi:hypothetical protein
VSKTVSSNIKVKNCLKALNNGAGMAIMGGRERVGVD